MGEKFTLGAPAPDAGTPTRWQSTTPDAPDDTAKTFTMGAPAPAPSFGDVAADVGKSALTQGTLGTADVAGAPDFVFGDIPHAAAHGMLWALDRMGLLPEKETPDTILGRLSQTKSAAEPPPGATRPTVNPTGVPGLEMEYPYLGAPSGAEVESVERQAIPALNYQPKTWEGKTAGEAARMGVSAAGLGGPGRTVFGRAGLGAVAGAGSELAGEAFEGTSLEPAARIAGAIATPYGWNVLRSFLGADSEAMRQMERALRADQANGTARMTPDQVTQARANGLEPTIYDYGGAQTDALLAKAGAATPTAQARLNQLNKSIKERLETTQGATRDNIKNTLGMSESAGDVEAKLAAANKAESKRLYGLAESNPAANSVTSPRLEQLATYEPVQIAMERARKYAQDPQFGIRPPGAPITLMPGAPPMAVPGNLQYWHQVQVELGKLVNAAKTDMDTSRMATWHNDLKNELDRLVPEYKTARSAAREGFGETDAIKAGYNVLGKPDTFTTTTLKNTYAKLSPEEQELFAQGVGQRLTEQAGKMSPQNYAKMLASPTTQERLINTLGQDKYDALYGHARSTAYMSAADMVQAQLRSSGWHSPGALIGGGSLVGSGIAAVMHYLPDLAFVAGVEPGVAAKMISAGVLGATIGGVKYTAERKIAPKLLELAQSSDPKDIQKFGQLLRENPAANSLFDRAQDLLTNAVLPAYRATAGMTSDLAAGAAGPAVGREGRASGGRVDAQKMAQHLIQVIDVARKRDAERTKPLLQKDDAIVARALAVAGRGI